MRPSSIDSTILNANGEKGISSYDIATRHGVLLGATLPLLATSWQQNRLTLGEEGRFACPPGGRRDDLIELDLRVDDRPRLSHLSDNRTLLAYDPADQSAA
ncbi:MAG: hypothetical protein AAF687_02025, partial [Pseudomonadota bacterium]